MKFSWVTLILLVFIVIFSIFIANVANLINIDRITAVNKLNVRRAEGDSSETLVDNEPRSGGLDGVRIGTSKQHLMWFMQISDIHISIFSDDQRIQQFREFAKETVHVIRPSVVLATGDLTDAKDADHLGSRQYLKEWRIYHDTVEESGVRNITTWLDIRGNHDNFNVPGDHSDQNYFQQFSVQGSQHRRSYMKQIDKGGERYTFIAVDACLEPGPKRPFNFIGVLSFNDTKHIVELANEARRNGGNHTFWFGHYPTSCIVTMETGSYGVRKLIGHYPEGVVYMCGHLHRLGGMVKRMYTLQNEGFLELELGDWKLSRIYRVAAMDHGLFSFVDVPHRQWPVILVTNPKHALFHLPGKENPNLQIDSTHIRILAFSPNPIEHCTVRINDKSWQDCQSLGDNLFVVEWDPTLYRRGMHSLEVVVADVKGRRQSVKQPFSLDGSRASLSFDLLARLVLMVDASHVFAGLFAVAASLCAVPIVFFRLWHILVVKGRVCTPRFQRSLFRRFWILSTVDRLSVPLVLYIVYLCVGPWAFGEVIDGHWGAIFAWGIYVNGGYLPGSLTYLYGFFQLTFCQLPLILILASRAECCYRQCVGEPKQPTTTFWRKCRNLPFFMILAIEVMLAIFFWNAYGALAFIVGPFRTWSVVLHVWLWYISGRLPSSTLRCAARVWSSADRKSENDNL